MLRITLPAKYTFHCEVPGITHQPSGTNWILQFQNDQKTTLVWSWSFWGFHQHPGSILWPILDIPTTNF